MKTPNYSRITRFDTVARFAETVKNHQFPAFPAGRSTVDCLYTIVDIIEYHMYSISNLEFFLTLAS